MKFTLTVVVPDKDNDIALSVLDKAGATLGELLEDVVFFTEAQPDTFFLEDNHD